MIGDLASHLWQSTWFAAMVALLTLAFRGNRARVRHGLWLCASLKFFLPFSLLIHMGGQWASRTIASPVVVPVAMERVAATLAEPVTFALTPAAVSPATDWRPIAIAALWACGFAFIAGVRLRGWRRVRAAMRASLPMEIAAAVEIRSAPGLLEPGVVGLLRPVLLLPEGIVDHLTTRQLETVLAHELCHVRRRDNLISALHMVVEAVFWFHPLVWWIGARLVEERERACDEGVLSLGSEPRDYAEAILSVCKLYVESPLVCVSGVTGADLKQRIEAIMNNRIGLGLNFTKKLLLASAGAAALVGPVIMGVLIGAGHAQALRAQSPVTPPLPASAQTTRPAQSATMPNVAAQRVNPPADPSAQLKRLLVLLLDAGSLTADEQTRAREAAIRFVQTSMQSNDAMSVMAATAGKLAVVQDFTTDKDLLVAAITRVGTLTESSVMSRLEALEQVANLLAPLPGKKALIYFTSGAPQQLSSAEQAEMQRAIDAGELANVAFYQVNVRIPSQNSRVDEARAKFGTTNGAMSRTYIRYGPPDQVEDRGAQGQIWRYNYLENFRSRVEFEFEPGNRPTGGRINWPPPMATYQGTPRETEDRYLAFMGRHATMQTYPAGEKQILSVPFDGLTSRVDITAEIRLAGANKGVVAASGREFINLDQTVTGAAYTMGYVLEAGSYQADVVVREQTTGKVFSESIQFQVN
jgi:beta-lactamase regulating signal transducer with metallopeptidase domain